ncbi:uncharacterized protein VP01_230g3 [Puccinia sorghi]|uniref:Uncharacterized protein n=1 Tax=Puccinia sorghi TaxID=27349 RepID=A0A0L6V9L6_9BASI|nr:uncharacterized protein VP01_230g3 [Puccinia sorghi]
MTNSITTEITVVEFTGDLRASTKYYITSAVVQFIVINVVVVSVLQMLKALLTPAHLLSNLCKLRQYILLNLDSLDGFFMATHVGSIRLPLKHSKIKLDNVLYCPSVCGTLISLVPVLGDQVVVLVPGLGWSQLFLKVVLLILGDWQLSLQWHNRLGHALDRFKSYLWFFVPPFDIFYWVPFFCETCAVAKSEWRRAVLRSEIPADNNLVVSDVLRLVSPADIFGNEYVLTLWDHATTFSYCFLLKSFSAVIILKNKLRGHYLDPLRLENTRLNCEIITEMKIIPNDFSTSSAPFTTRLPGSCVVCCRKPKTISTRCGCSRCYIYKLGNCTTASEPQKSASFFLGLEVELFMCDTLVTAWKTAHISSLFGVVKSSSVHITKNNNKKLLQATSFIECFDPLVSFHNIWIWAVEETLRDNRHTKAKPNLYTSLRICMCQLHLKSNIVGAQTSMETMYVWNISTKQKIKKNLRNLPTSSFLYSLNLYRDTKWIILNYLPTYIHIFIDIFREFFNMILGITRREAMCADCHAVTSVREIFLSRQHRIIPFPIGVVMACFTIPIYYPLFNIEVDISYLKKENIFYKIYPLKLIYLLSMSDLLRKLNSRLRKCLDNKIHCNSYPMSSIFQNLQKTHCDICVELGFIRQTGISSAKSNNSAINFPFQCICFVLFFIIFFCYNTFFILIIEILNIELMNSEIIRNHKFSSKVLEYNIGLDLDFSTCFLNMHKICVFPQGQCTRPPGNIIIKSISIKSKKNKIKFVIPLPRHFLPPHFKSPIFHQIKQKNKPKFFMFYPLQNHHVRFPKKNSQSQFFGFSTLFLPLNFKYPYLNQKTSKKGKKKHFIISLHFQTQTSNFPENNTSLWGIKYNKSTIRNQLIIQKLHSSLMVPKRWNINLNRIYTMLPRFWPRKMTISLLVPTPPPALGKIYSIINVTNMALIIKRKEEINYI